MLTKYTRKQLNQIGFDKDVKYVLASDAEKLLMQFIEVAVESGADQDKLLEVVKNV